MIGSPRDLAELELWMASLTRSHSRRKTKRTSPSSPLLAIERESFRRDLALHEPWELSLSRSVARRSAQQVRFVPSKAAARGVSIAAVAAAIAAPTATAVSGGSGRPATPVAAAQANPLLFPGSNGPAVAVVQRALGLSADGIYGPRTQTAVRSFQASHGLLVDAIVGPQTRGALGFGGSAGSRPVGYVASVQRALGVGADGVYGPVTAGAVRSFQASHGLARDGVVGPATSAALGLGSQAAVLRTTQGQSAGPSVSRPASSAPSRSGGGSSRSRSVSTGSGSPGVVQQVIAGANRIATTPYRYGGGHGSFRDSGYDCSGSVSYALHAGGLLKAPEDSRGLMSYGAAGPGRHITVYSSPGHAYMVINGRRFDTSGRRISGSRWTSMQRSSGGFVARHPSGL